MGTIKVANVGVVGGGIRGSMFARAIEENPDSRLIAICDPSEQTQHKLAQQFEAPIYSSVEEMLSNHPGLTAAVIATPDFAHRDPAVVCLNRGLDLMLEKPLATTSADAEAIIYAAEKNKARIMVGFENRWNPRFIAVRDYLNTVKDLQIVNQNVSLNDTFYVPTKMLSWANKSSPAWFLMPHSLDLAIWFSGKKPVSVFARGSRGRLLNLGIETWDSVTATFVMEDDSYVVLNSSWILPESAPAPYEFRFEIQSVSDVLHIEGGNHGVTKYGAEGVEWIQTGVYERNQKIRGVPVDMINDFIQFVRLGNLDVPTEQDGLIVTKSIEAVHKSLVSKASVEIK